MKKKEKEKKRERERKIEINSQISKKSKSAWLVRMCEKKLFYHAISRKICLFLLQNSF